VASRKKKKKTQTTLMNKLKQMQRKTARGWKNKNLDGKISGWK